MTKVNKKERMCYSFELSLVAFIAVTISGTVAVGLPGRLRQPILGSLMLCYGLMQVSEMLIWHGVRTGNASINRAGTLVGKYTLPAHNIAIGIGVLVAYWHADRSQLPLGGHWSMRWAPLVAGLLFYAGAMVNYALVPDTSDTTPVCRLDRAEDTDRCTKNSARLQWPFTHRYYAVSYALSFALLLLYVKPLWPNGALITFFYTFSWIVTFALGKIPVQGSFWCWAAAIFAPLLLAGNTYLGHRAQHFVS